jgi:NAD-dependent SIR2 family protein deacetylase
MKKNLVFVFGAGYSKNAGLPLQRELLPEIMAYDDGDFHFKIARENVKTFISENFPGVKIENLTLEDLFTILDKAVMGKEYFGGYHWQALYGIRKSLVHMLLVLIDARMEAPKKPLSLYSSMGRFVIDCGSLESQYDASIISLNWDTLFELIVNELDSIGNRISTPIDFCVFSDTLGNPTGNIPPKSGLPTSLKIMKLHGSINWLYCPNCGRLYIDRYNNIAVDYKTPCPNCLGIAGQDIILEEMIITPTMLKEFQNHHLRLIWQNAFLNLNRADVVVFIGYSLPLADFELRYFFKKALPQNIDLNVVLHSIDKLNGTKERYENFFGTNIRFCFEGFENWWGKVPF